MEVMNKNDDNGKFKCISFYKHEVINMKV